MTTAKRQYVDNLGTITKYIDDDQDLESYVLSFINNLAPGVTVPYKMIDTRLDYAILRINNNGDEFYLRIRHDEDE